MEQLVANINKLNNHVGNQSGDISQVSSSIEEMIANIDSVTGTLVSNAGNVKTLQDASEIGRAGLYVNEISGRNREAIDVVIKEVSQFKAE